MRIVIDMQGAQSSGSWNRGIGRYTLSLASALVKNRGEHEVLLALSGFFPEAIERIRAKFEGLLSQENIRVWSAVAPRTLIDTTSDWHRQSGELVREAFLASLKPDVLLVSSLFEGLVDDAVTSISSSSEDFATAVILYDLIPFIQRKPYLEDPFVAAWYLNKIEHLRRANLWLAISESSQQEGVGHLDLPVEHCINISTDADEHFRPIEVSTETEQELRNKYGLARNFVMYTGGIDHRKNIEGLIRAYARLPSQLRASHQLAIVCSVGQESRHRLLQLSKDHGLNTDELVLTGYVSEDDLIALYNLCSLFVFPSWHEGFGLPALEAMRCGAPVIAANASSLPEVVGLSEALFDPHSDEAITSAITRVLVDPAFRERLIAHGKQQAERFSWHATARCAIAAMELVVNKHQTDRASSVHQLKRPKLAYVSPLQPERSGISDYSAELLPVLAGYYEIDVVVVQDCVSDPWVKANCPIRSVQWFVENADHFDRVLYHFGNSAYHQHMFGLLNAIPGVVVLHDFYLSGVLHHMEAIGYAPGCFTAQLYRSHGYAALFDRAHFIDVAEVFWKYPCSRKVIESSVGTIVHSENSIHLAQHWYGDIAQDWSVIPLLRGRATLSERFQARNALGISEAEFVICTFGMIAPSKLNHRLLQAWLNSKLAKRNSSRLIFVGENHPGEYGNKLSVTISQHSDSSPIEITGWVDQNKFHQYLAAADLAVQLRTLSRGETSAAVLDCMNYGLATIVNANGSMADLDEEAVWKLPDEFTDQELIHALEILWRDHGRRKEFGAKARKIIVEQHNPITCAGQYASAIERCYKSNRPVLNHLLQSISTISSDSPSDNELISLASTIATSFPPSHVERQLLVDISELMQSSIRTGRQLIVGGVLKEWLLNPPSGWRVEPVYATTAHSYRYGRQFTTAFLGIPSVEFVDDPIDFTSGDVFFGLSMQQHVQTVNADFYQYLRQHGVTVKFMVHDLLGIQQPDYFEPDAVDEFTNWLHMVGESDGAVCSSKAIADQLSDWMRIRTWKRLRPFAIDWCHLGAHVAKVGPILGMPSDAMRVLAALEQRRSFLIVATLDQHPIYAQTLDAFEYLWHCGTDVNLVIVGKQGWIPNGLHTHPELRKRLLCFEGISDEYLGKIYAASTALIATTFSEDYGLPLIEGAPHLLPIMACNLPALREATGGYVYHFEAHTAEAFATAVLAWLDLYDSKLHPNQNAMNWPIWNRLANQLLKIVKPLHQN